MGAHSGRICSRNTTRKPKIQKETNCAWAVCLCLYGPQRLRSLHKIFYCCFVCSGGIIAEYSEYKLWAEVNNKLNEANLSYWERSLSISLAYQLAGSLYVSAVCWGSCGWLIVMPSTKYIFGVSFFVVIFWQTRPLNCLYLLWRCDGALISLDASKAANISFEIETATSNTRRTIVGMYLAQREKCMVMFTMLGCRPNKDRMCGLYTQRIGCGSCGARTLYHTTPRDLQFGYLHPKCSLN